MNSFLLSLCTFLITCLVAVPASSEPFVPTVSTETFRGYWFDGTGEITTYRLEQARYGELHEGTATLIFVTEPFLPVKQVKDEKGHAHSVPVLKLNFVKNFNTGVYPYSMMLSTFTQLDGSGRILKASETTQDWCGHTFSQVNWRGTHFDYLRYSYFEAEGDFTRRVEDVWQEDQLWTLARLNPHTLPTGSIQIWPGAFYTRLIHNPPVQQEATATLKRSRNGLRYRVEFSKTDRVLEIFIKDEFPFQIQGWEETYTGIAWNGKAKRLKTKATAIHSEKSDYWNRHRNSDRP